MNGWVDRSVAPVEEKANSEVIIGAKIMKYKLFIILLSMNIWHEQRERKESYRKDICQMKLNYVNCMHIFICFFKEKKKEKKLNTDGVKISPNSRKNSAKNPKNSTINRPNNNRML